MLLAKDYGYTKADPDKIAKVLSPSQIDKVLQITAEWKKTHPGILPQMGFRKK
jgi:hypothetical protein